MVYLFCSFLCFFLSVVFHIVLSRILLLFGKKSILLTTVFAGGGLAHFMSATFLAKAFSNYDGNLFFTPLSLSSYLLYLILVFIYLVYFLSTYSGEQSPSLTLYFLLRDGKGRSMSEIKSGFPKKEMIDMRIASLENGQFIKKIKDKYFVLPMGERLAYVFRLYRKALGWSSSG